MYICDDCGSTFDIEYSTCPECGENVRYSGHMRPNLENMEVNRPMRPKDHLGGHSGSDSNKNRDIGKIVIIIVCVLYLLSKIISLIFTFVDLDLENLFKEIYEYEENSYSSSEYYDTGIYEV